MQETVVLGMDVSTAATGYAVLRKEGRTRELLAAGVMELSSEAAVYSKAELVAARLRAIAAEYQVNRIVIEEPLQRFTRGLSSANTIAALLRFNGIVAYLAQKEFGIAPDMVSVTAARSTFGIKIPKGSANGKEIVLSWVKSQPEFSSFTWPTKVLRGGPRRGQTIEDKVCYDIADASVMGLYGCL